MQGFKSFPDRTVIDFHEGITAIVGPNGSGKSNITDAILWVLGEQSAKTLRGSRMEDVIFSGTETRRQLGFAEVTIVFDNSDHNIPIEYETVEVTRRYYRSGDSEYLINQVECRLKDIRALFVDTGIGRDGYSIIGQGKIDQILSDNSEDRRKVFDEAAGIVKYKLRKRDTERKLERTENNLLRLQDILQELEHRIKPLKTQVDKLKKYNSLSSEMENIDIALLIHDISRNEKELSSQEEAIKDLSSDLEDARRIAQELKNKYHQFDQNLSEIDEKIEELRLQHSSKNADLAELGEKKAIVNERQRSLSIQIERDKSQLEELHIAIKYLDSDLEQKDSKIIELNKTVVSLKKRFNSESEKLEAHTEHIHFLNSEINNFRQVREEERNQIFQLQNKKSNLEQEIKFVGQQCRELNQELEELKEEIVLESDVIDKQSKVFLEEQGKFEEISSDLQKARHSVESKRNDLTALDEIKQKLTNKINNLEYRLQTLYELEASREGYHQAVKAIMEKADNDLNFAKGIHGPLAEFITVDQEYEKAIEVSLGGALHNVITQSKEDASNLIEWLRKTQSGRETFLPLDVIKGKLAPDSDLIIAKDIPGFIGLASEHVEFDSLYQGIIDQLLGRVLMAKNIDAALDISARLKRKYRIVTLAGDIVQVGGSMTGGHGKKASPGLLARKRDINQYQADLKDLTNQLENNDKDIEKENHELLLLGQIQQDLEEQFLTKEKNLYSLETIVSQKNRDLKQKEIEVDEKTKNLQKFKERIDQVKDSLSLKNKDLVKILADLDKGQANLVLLEKKIAESEKIRKELQDKVLEANVLLQTKEQALKNLSNVTVQTKQDFTQQQNKQAQLKKDLVTAENELETLLKNKLSYSNEYDILEKSIVSLSEAIKEKQIKRSEVEKQQGQLFSEVEKQADQVSNLQLHLERSKQKAERLTHSISTAKNRIWETYELTYIELDPQEYPLKNITDSRDRLRELKLDVKNLGSINPNAIEEYNEISERYDFMVLQLEDIQKAKTSLTEVIVELEKAMSEQFLASFAVINKNFKDVFSALFIGGEAELVLESDDLLTSGIQIKAQPPGKRLQNMNLLSGGERSLTAIALLLAIFRLRPAPFCVLDEVESALDESNIIRFTDYLESYTDQTQFVLVTHRKGTMESADRLYGITMKERGVSKVLSLALTDADTIDQEGNLTVEVTNLRNQ